MNGRGQCSDSARKANGVLYYVARGVPGNHPTIVNIDILPAKVSQVQVYKHLSDFLYQDLIHVAVKSASMNEGGIEVASA